MILVCVFAVVDGCNADVGRIFGGNRFCNLGFDSVHFDNLRILVRSCLVKVGDGRFFPGVPHDGKAYNLHLGFGDAVVQLTKPKSAELGFGENRPVIVTGRRNDGVVLVQGNAPFAPTILEFFEVSLVHVGQVDAVTYKADVRVEGAVTVNIFGIVGTFA